MLIPAAGNFLGGTLAELLPESKRQLSLALLGATVGYFAPQGAGDAVKIGLLAFTAGVLATATIEDIVPEAHEERDTRLAPFCFIGGFSLFMLLAFYLRR